MRRLFTDPHFNKMDGLDIYIDDYGKPDPIPMAMLRMMNQARSLGLFSDDDDELPDSPRREPERVELAASATGVGHEAVPGEPGVSESAGNESAEASDAGDATPQLQSASPASHTDSGRS